MIEIIYVSGDVIMPLVYFRDILRLRRVEIKFVN